MGKPPQSPSPSPQQQQQSQQHASKMNKQSKPAAEKLDRPRRPVLPTKLTAAGRANVLYQGTTLGGMLNGLEHAAVHLTFMLLIWLLLIGAYRFVVFTSNSPFLADIVASFKETC